MEVGEHSFAHTIIFLCAPGVLCGEFYQYYRLTK